jgi:hypothetical protein
MSNDITRDALELLKDLLVLVEECDGFFYDLGSPCKEIEEARAFLIKLGWIDDAE